MSNIHRKHILRKKKLKSLYDKVNHSSYYSVIYYDYDKDRYIRLYRGKRSDSYSNALKNKGKRKIRNHNDIICYKAQYLDGEIYSTKKNCDYKKEYDY